MKVVGEAFITLAGFAGAGGSIVLGVVQAIEPTTAITGLLTAGPVGAFGALMWWRNREQDREHQAERAKMAEEYAAERRETREMFAENLRENTGELRRMSETLASIRTNLERGRE